VTNIKTKEIKVLKAVPILDSSRRGIQNWNGNRKEMDYFEKGDL
jgi:hypothetical protein